MAADPQVAHLRPLGPWLTELVADHFRRERLPPDLLGAFTSDRVRVAKTASRHMLGIMNDVTFYIHAAIAGSVKAIFTVPVDSPVAPPGLAGTRVRIPRHQRS